jgi:hypothetical protein
MGIDCTGCQRERDGRARERTYSRSKSPSWFVPPAGSGVWLTTPPLILTSVGKVPMDSVAKVVKNRSRSVWVYELGLNPTMAIELLADAVGSYPCRLCQSTLVRVDERDVQSSRRGRTDTPKW